MVGEEQATVSIAEAVAKATDAAAPEPERDVKPGEVVLAGAFDGRADRRWRRRYAEPARAGEGAQAPRGELEPPVGAAPESAMIDPAPERISPALRPPAA
jgi:hypothetical protein